MASNAKNCICSIDKYLPLWYHRGHAGLIEQRGEVAAFSLRSGKSGGQLDFGVSFAEPAAALDFCENEISMLIICCKEQQKQLKARCVFRYRLQRCAPYEKLMHG